MRVALYQPEIPQNVGTLLRTAACFGLGVDIIKPCGFPFSSKDLKRAAMDYTEGLDVLFHDSFNAFQACYKQTHRIILITTQAPQAYTDFTYTPTDIVLLGRESAGVPPEVHAQATASVTIPMAPGRRSLNVAVSGGIVMGELRRQIPI